MSTEHSETESSIAKRTRRACVESMTVHPHGGGSGMFDVYNADGKRYVVDLRDGVCECPDFEHREPEGGCKHARRCRLEFGIEDVPASIRSEHAAITDVELARRRRGVGVDLEPITVSDTKPARRVATDGGTVVSATETRGESDGDAPACVCEIDPDGLGCFEHFVGSDR